jgi:hypothetical protein
MSTKMEQLLDLIVNEEMDKANELFHEIVVEKSREIYENLIAEETEEESVEEADDAEEEPVDEADDAEEESVEEAFGMDDDESSSEIGGTGDASDDFEQDVMDPTAMGDEEGGEEEPASKADVMDLKDALEELTREFEALVSGDDADDSEDDEFEPADDEEDGEEDGEDEEGDDDESENMGFVREYRERVGNDWEKNSMKSPGPVGSGTGDKAGQTSVDGGKSPVSSGKGKPTTGATAHNITQGGTGVGENTGTRPNGKTGGLVGGVKGKFTGSGTHNVDGVQTGVKTLSKQGSGYPGNNKTAGGVGSGTGDKAGQTSVSSTPSPLTGAPGRNA